MKVLLAKSAGFCFGVRRAVELAGQIADGGQPYVMLGPVIHNDHVIADLAPPGGGLRGGHRPGAGGLRGHHPLPRGGEGGL